MDAPSRVVHASLISTRYRDDFGGVDAAVGQFMANYFPDGAERQLLLSGSFDLKQTPYDWALNSQEQEAGRPVTIP